MTTRKPGATAHLCSAQPIPLILAREGRVCRLRGRTRSAVSALSGDWFWVQETVRSRTVEPVGATPVALASYLGRARGAARG